MFAPVIVEVEVGGEVSSCFGNALVCLEIDLLVFDASPRPFDEDIVHPAAPAVHADLDAVSVKQTVKPSEVNWEP